MLYKNQTVDLAVTSMTFEGLGVARYTDSDLQNFVVFVQGAATGDVAECTILKTEKHYAYAAVKRLKTASPFRLSGFCSAQGKCGGCAFGHISYEHELAVKKAFVEQEFRKNFTGNTLRRRKFRFITRKPIGAFSVIWFCAAHMSREKSWRFW